MSRILRIPVSLLGMAAVGALSLATAAPADARPGANSGALTSAAFQISTDPAVVDVAQG